MGRHKTFTKEEQKLKQKFYTKRWQQKNKEKQAEYNRKWAENNPEKIAEQKKCSYEKIKLKNPGYLKEQNKKHFKKERLKPDFRKKQSERNRINNLFKRRNIIKPCEICNSLKTEIHHQDYNDIGDIIFLCHKHHIQLHALLKKIDE